jgi:hypothetical protein
VQGEGSDSSKGEQTQRLLHQVSSWSDRPSRLEHSSSFCGVAGAVPIAVLLFLVGIGAALHRDRS